MIVKSLPLLVFAFVSCAANAADTYRWEDKEGRVYYSDQLPPTGARNVRRAQVDGNGDSEQLPYRLKIAVDSAPVTLYVTQCGKPCDQARQLLVKRGVPHTMMDATQADAQEALTALTGGGLEVPVVKIGKTVIRGFEEERWNAALDAAGYPSYAMIKVKPQVPQQNKAVAKSASDVVETGYDSPETEITGPGADESINEGSDAQNIESDEVEPANVGQTR